MVLRLCVQVVPRIMLCGRDARSENCLTARPDGFSISHVQLMASYLSWKMTVPVLRDGLVQRTV